MSLEESAEKEYESVWGTDMNMHYHDYLEENNKEIVVTSSKGSEEYVKKSIKIIEEDHINFLERTAKKVIGRNLTERKLKRFRRMIDAEAERYTNLLKILLQQDYEKIRECLKPFKTKIENLLKRYIGQNE